MVLVVVKSCLQCGIYFVRQNNKLLVNTLTCPYCGVENSPSYIRVTSGGF